ncbi:MAG: PQQ-dependent sugar dehydrogenase [Casimicrobiaceae bacterium]
MTTGRNFRSVLLAALLVCLPLAAFADSAAYLRGVAGGYSAPLEIAAPGDGSGRLFIVQKGGLIKILKNGQQVVQPFLDLSALLSTSGERGLLGLAFHPQFASNRYFYVYYTRSSDGAITIARYQRNATLPDVADPASGSVLLTIAHSSFDNHNGGHLAFGSDGYLYIGTGDGGSGGDPFGNGQRKSALLGKMLRLDVNGGSPYSIPADNPFAGSTCAAGACPEIWAYGLRNPWKFSFDSVTHDLWIGDVGQNTWEEIDFQQAGSAGGRNYGWRCWEASYVYSFTADDGPPPTPCPAQGSISFPIIEYFHGDGDKSVTGGYRYRGTQIPTLAGQYVFGDFISGHVWSAQPQNTPVWDFFRSFANVPQNPATFGVDDAGELYVAAYSTGQLFKFVRSIPVADFNNDATSDLLWRHDNGSVAVWLNNGSANPPTAHTGSADAVYSIAAIGDVDGDGHDDVVWRRSSGEILAWLMNSDGSTLKGTRYYGKPDATWHVLAASDFNNDGFTDIVWRRDSGEVLIWMLDNSSSGIRETRTPGVADPAQWDFIGAADINRDGYRDIIWRNKATGRVLVWYMRGGNYNSTGDLGVAGLDWTLVAIADFDGDQSPDLLWRRINGDVLVWLMDGATIRQTVGYGAIAGAWQIQSVGDVDGDGVADLLWRRADGTLLAWVLDHNAAVSRVITYGAVDTHWHIQGAVPTQ